MQHRPSIRSILLKAGLAPLALVACSHDAPRENPLDPTLTPPVTLQAFQSDSTGHVTLVWSTYEGDHPFSSCRVERKVQGQERWSVMDTLTTPEQTTSVDSSLTPGTAYDYRVVVVNTEGYESPSDRQSVGGYSVGPVPLLPVEPDPQVGALRVSWTQYRDPGFERYNLTRREVGTDQDVRLVSLSVVTDTVFVDTTARHGVSYQYALGVRAAGQDLVGTQQEGRLLLPAVESLASEFHSESASVTLTWTPYTGPRFAAYQIHRWTAESARQVADVIEDSTTNTYEDGGLPGNAEHRYQVVVVTDRGEEVRGAEASGKLHEWLATWQFDHPDMPGLYPRIRLQGRAEGGVVACSRPDYQPPVVMELDAQGGDVGTLVAVGPNSPFRPASVGTGMTTTPGGRTAIAMTVHYPTEGGSGRTYGSVLLHDADGRAIWSEEQIYSGTVPGYDGGDESIVSGEVWLSGTEANFTAISVESDGQALHTQDFTDFPVRTEYSPFHGQSTWGGPSAGDWALPATVGTWEFAGREVATLVSYGTGLHRIFLDHAEARMAEDTWRDFQLVAEATWGEAYGMELPRDGRIGVSIGGDSYSRYALTMHTYERTASLAWQFSPSKGSGAQRDSFSVSVPFASVPFARYRLSLGAVDGHVEASIARHPVWSAEVEPLPRWCSIAPLGEVFAVCLYDRPYVVYPDGEAVEMAPLDAGISEIRVWHDSRGRRYVGLALPTEDVMLTGPVPPGFEDEWPDLLTRTLQPTSPQGSSLLHYPVSFDVGPDGRTYVLDAGNDRIVVLTSGGRYITHWGVWGEDDGQFNFGTGVSDQQTGRDLSGSIAVDGQGYIYVADGKTNRIQKFAP